MTRNLVKLSLAAGLALGASQAALAQGHDFKNCEDCNRPTKIDIRPIPEPISHLRSGAILCTFGVGGGLFGDIATGLTYILSAGTVHPKGWWPGQLTVKMASEGYAELCRAVDPEQIPGPGNRPPKPDPEPPKPPNAPPVAEAPPEAPPKPTPVNAPVDQPVPGELPEHGPERPPIYGPELPPGWVPPSVGLIHQAGVPHGNTLVEDFQTQTPKAEPKQEKSQEQAKQPAPEQKTAKKPKRKRQRVVQRRAAPKPKPPSVRPRISISLGFGIGGGRSRNGW